MSASKVLRLALMCTGAAWVAATPVTAFAQDTTTQPAAAAADSSQAAPDDATAGLGEIIVTAQRRSESIQKTPLAISAVGAEALTKSGAVDATALTRLVPSVQISNAGHAQTFFIRGIGSFVANSLGDPAVALSVGGVFLARPYMLPGQFFDLERVEVLKGPQGTLYGRNATGGALNLIPKAPTFTNSADAALDVGNYSAIRGEAAANLALSPSLAFRGSFQIVSRDGYLSNGVSDDRHQSGRAQVRWEPDGRLSINLLGDYTHITGKGIGAIDVHNFDQDDRVITTDPKVLAILAQSGETKMANQQFVRDNIYGISGTVNYRSDLGTFTLIPAYRDSHVRFGIQTGFDYNANEKEHQYSTEFRFASDIPGPLKFVLGSYYLHETSAVDYGVSGGFPFPTPFGQKSHFRITTGTYALFADGTLKILPGVRLIGGVRYTDERKSAQSSGVIDTGAPVPAIKGRIAADKVTWRAGAEVDLRQDSLLYATVATGFHSGGFFVTIDDPKYRPEQITAYTAGIKNRFFNRKLLLNLEIFRWNFKDQQFSYLGLDSSFNATYITGNVGASKIQGAEVDVQYMLPTNTTLSVNGQYLNSKFKSFTYATIAPRTGCPFLPNAAGPGFVVNCTGLRPPNSPEWNITTQVQQNLRLANGRSIELRGLAHYQTATYVSFDFLPEEKQKAYWQFDASISYDISDRFGVSAYMNNITNKTIISNALAAPYTGIIAPGPGVTSAQILAPRTFGVRLMAHF